MQISEEDARDLAIKLISPIEELLDKHNIKVPDEDRTGDDTEASLFGETHAILEDDLVQLIREHMLTLGERPEQILDPAVYAFMDIYDGSAFPTMCLPEELPAFERKFIEESDYSSLEEHEEAVENSIHVKYDYKVLDGKLSNFISGHLLAHIITNAVLNHPVRGMLDISTNHLPMADIDILKGSDAVYYSSEGWIIRIDPNDTPADMSDAFEKAVKKANGLGCDFISIHPLASEHDDLEKFDHGYGDE